MKFLRVLAGGLLLLLMAIGAIVWYAAQHQSQLIRLVLVQIAQRTGLEIEVSGTRLGLGARLVVVLEHPRVVIDHKEAARLGAIRAAFSYWALLHRTGLPLYSLVFERGSITLTGPSNSSELWNLRTASEISQIKALELYLERLASVSRRFELEDISLLSQNAQPYAEHVDGVAYRQHYRHGTWPWLVQFTAETDAGLLAGARFAGDLELGRGKNNSSKLVQARVHFSNIAQHINLAAFKASAQLDGDFNVAVFSDAQAAGSFKVTTRDLMVNGDALSNPVTFGSLSSRGDYRLSQTRAELFNFELDNAESAMLEADATVLNPYESSRTLTFSAAGVTLELADTPKWLRSLRAVPPLVLRFAEGLRSGALTLTEVALKTPTSLKKLNQISLVRLLEVNAMLTHVSYAPPPDLHLPPVYQFDAQVTYSSGVARLRQATSQIGGSSLSDINLDLDLRATPRQIPYRLQLAAWLDAGDLYNAIGDFVRQMPQGPFRQLLWVHGHLAIQLQTNGTIEALRPAPPSLYLVTAQLGDVEFELNKVPAAIWLSSGDIVLEPGRLSLHKIVAVPIHEDGNLVVDGTIVPATTPVQFRELTVELHQLESARWLPLFIDPNQFSVIGPLGGRIVANSQEGREIPTIIGKLTLDSGMVQPGFLRNPIMVTHSATLLLDGKGLVLDIPASRLEGEALDFRMTLPDYAHPQLRIDASVARLDFEAMRFIRLPWSRGTPPTFFPVPVSGHIEARVGNFDKLPMTDISTDFHHNSQTWRVDKFRANAFEGTIDLTLSGRIRNDWINMTGVIADMDAGPLFLLAGESQQPPIVGKLAATGDLWANTNTDFFATLAGRVSITMTDGTLNRFTLLKRILSLINLKNYLTAQFPDPRKSGIPFKTLDADFRGTKGNFYTDDLRLNGPVMDITARGNIDFANSTMDMEIDLLALQTVNWLINNIPIIGKHLGDATKHLVGAYFQVEGPIAHPAIRPKPLTSVGQFVLKTLALPINIIAPNTVR
jgi:hypothetical protein